MVMEMHDLLNYIVGDDGLLSFMVKQKKMNIMYVRLIFNWR